MQKRVTSADVAREAGLSRATVSYVLNGDPRQQIPEPTRQRVHEAAAKLGYRPYGPARLLRGAKSRLVLMFTPGLEHASDFVAADIITRLGDELSTSGLHLMWQLGDSETQGASIDLAPAVVLSSARESEDAFVQLTRQFEVPVLPAFPGLDEFIAGAAATQVEHLASHGRSQLAFAAPDQVELGPTAALRWGAVQRAAERLGLPEPVHVVVPTGREGARSALSRLLDEQPSATGICAYNDVVAFGVLAAAADLDVAIPERVAVIGVDDHPLAPLSVPALTTVRADVGEFVTGLARAVVAAAHNEPIPPVLLPTRSVVVERASG
ncbi:LacI family DNA-binding transcriptional regulator [Microbacterium trichothecenolyticum]|uniref:LacI family DNA-binding transcriptional regulator n=1 Tax=Microbacterium ureisolvens TaxID=2781186 RepID=A0ABS7I2Q9_9MICO|nr:MULTISPECIES: LacI family DNA-binding transcriptional regulator [Microbacterium]MBW9111954.1 LacI family DNA-binding transcriptional regulator [Microbacterium ureisolvens]MBW9122377.1 LacI family DNA-binding transcriptional regulator [Microbacterium trichothecenolyticum]